MSAYIIPVIFLVVLLLSFLRRREPYGGFIDGARQAVDLTINVFPYLLAVMVAVEAFRVSGASAYLADMLAPVLGKVGLPKELAELLFLRPVSGAGSLAILDGIYETYGPDSYVGRSFTVRATRSFTSRRSMFRNRISAACAMLYPSRLSRRTPAVSSGASSSGFSKPLADRRCPGKAKAFRDKRNAFYVACIVISRTWRT